jgi:hypothetical protein
MAKIPRFRSLERAAKFWDTHDFEDFVEDTEPVTVTVTIPRRRKTLKVPIDLKIYRQIEALAAKRRVRAETIVSRWLRERARQESAAR